MSKTLRTPEKLFLSRPNKREDFKDRGRCIFDESILKKPVNKRPICSVYEIIAKHLALPITQRSLGNRGIPASEIHSRFDITPENATDFLRVMHAFFCRKPKEWVDYIKRPRQMPRQTCFGYKFPKNYRPPAFSPINALEYILSTSKKPREDAVINFLLSVNQLRSSPFSPDVSFARLFIKMADSFARSQLAEGRLISCANCKKGQSLSRSLLSALIQKGVEERLSGEWDTHNEPCGDTLSFDANLALIHSKGGK